MPSVPPILLTNASGQTYLIGVTNDGRLTSTPIPGSGPSVIPITDIFSGSTWNLVVLNVGDPLGPPGELRAIPTAHVPAPTQIIVEAPNTSLFAIQVNSGVPSGTSPLQTVPASGCAFSLADADAALAARLYDTSGTPPGQFWSQPERILYLTEALRTWNALTGYWRADFTFQSASPAQWYDMTDTIAMPNTLRPLTLTGTDLATVIEYHLLEPPVGAGPWTGSAQFSIPDIQGAIQRRRNEAIGTAGCTVTRILVPAVAGRTALPLTVVDLRRVAFIPADPSIPTSVLWQDDTWALESLSIEYTLSPAGIPTIFAVSTEPWLTFDVDTPPLPGQFELLVVAAGYATSGADTLFSPLTVPDDWSWVVKFGALSDLFGRESNAKDPLRQSYCEQRYRDALPLLARAPALLAARSNNAPLLIDSVRESDSYATDWQAQPLGPPSTLLTAGLNLLALSPAPDAPSDGPYSIQLTVVENAPIPPTLTTCLLLDRSIFDVIVDYAQHLAALKMGGAEFLATMPLYHRFLAMAAVYSAKLLQMGEFTEALYALSRRQEERDPRIAPSALEQAVSND